MNTMKLEFVSRLENEAFARTSAVAFLMPLNLDMEAIMEIKTMLAEAIVNAMIHGYESRESGTIVLQISYDEEFIHMTVQDEGCGIDDLQLAMQPLYTSKKHMERSGMGMTIMQTFADDFHIESEKGKGTLVTIKKRIHHGKDSEKLLCSTEQRACLFDYPTVFPTADIE